MGLGKTVEVLALVMAHKWPGLQHQQVAKNAESANQVEDMDVDANVGASAPKEDDVVESPAEGVADSNAVGVVDSKVVGGANSMATDPEPVGVVEGVAIPDMANPTALADGGTSAKAVVLDEVRCLCGAMKEDQSGREFVQCEHCLVWQHSSCVQFDSVRDSSFVCIKCLIKKVHCTSIKRHTHSLSHSQLHS